MSKSIILPISVVSYLSHVRTFQLGGCFGTGRGRLKVTDPIIEFDTGVMVEDKA
jgi:hypothetical protein